jgi:hypothetical protein
VGSGRGRGPRRGGPPAGSGRGAARRGRRGVRDKGHAWRKKGEGEGKRERERGGEGELTSGSKSSDHRLQNLGHHGGERERWERERGCCAGEIK